MQKFFICPFNFFLNSGETFLGKKFFFCSFCKSHKILLQKMFMGNDICQKSTKMFLLSHFQSVQMVGASALVEP